MNNQPNIIWIDGEFTGINFSKNRLLEIAVVVTDSELNVMGTPVSLVIHHDLSEIDSILEDWPRNQFSGEGNLLDQVEKSTISMVQAQEQVMKYVSEFTRRGTSPLAGNSVSGDRRVLEKDMPDLVDWLHYRTIDVSTIKELAKRWNPKVYNQVKKKETHRALDDIMESINELKLYREHLFQKNYANQRI